MVPLPETSKDLDDRIRVAPRRRPKATRHVRGGRRDDPDVLLGTVGWSFHAPAPLQVADVGYAVHPDARGRGVATRALRTLTRWLTDDPEGPGWRGCSSTTAWRTPRRAAWRRRPASSARACGGPTSRCGTPTRPDGVRRHDVCLHGFVPAPEPGP